MLWKSEVLLDRCGYSGEEQCLTSTSSHFLYYVLYACGQPNGTFFPVWTTLTYACMVSCYFITESNVKLCLNLLPVRSTAKLPSISMHLQWKLCCLTHISTVQAASGKCYSIVFLPLQSMHQILFCLVIHWVRLFLKLQPQPCFLHSLVFCLTPDAWTKRQ